MNKKTIKAYNAKIINQIREKIQTLLSANDMHYDFDVDSQYCIYITIEGGDWKHDHIRLKILMRNNGYIFCGSENFDEFTCGDWYSAIHKFR